ncbi:MAG TPA: HAD family acid phosphatase [Pirellulales bacterium]|jgi:predicted secreted acid phosphatase|nr:HAD family acid phosphatase [Pirellulales bacterium]
MNSPLRPMTAHNTLHGLLYQATSAEYIALCVQMYQLARHALLERLRSGTFRYPAVIFDLDETVLDNSAYAAWQIQAGTNFDESTSWKEWCDAGESGAVPGAVEFVRFVEEAGATPIFITTRLNATRAGTARNLKKLGVLNDAELKFEETMATAAHHARETRLFMKGMPDVNVERPQGEVTYKLGNKFLQRVFCTQVRGFEIILSVGDNLSDYAEYYGRVFDPSGAPASGEFPTISSRRASVLQDLNLFGRDFVLLPNATYGGWLSAFELNRLGASDELASTGDPVRQGLAEPQAPFVFGDGESITALGPKFSKSALRIWSGPKGASKSVQLETTQG